MDIHWIDITLFLLFAAGTMAFGLSFAKQNKNVSDYTKGGGSIPGLVVGMSIFATYVSSISFLGLPGNAYSGSWNAFVFSLSIPVASILAARYFVPFYRSIGSISAYSFLETRFGYWARAYAAVCYLLTQVARIGSVLFLLALSLHYMLGWSVASIIVITGLGVVLYSVVGGIKAVIWTDAIQSTILILGALACVVLLFVDLPGGISQFISVGKSADKFTLGPFDSRLDIPTFWVTLCYGIFINLQNYGIDQNYVQRYKSASDDKGARFSALFGGLIYLPVSFLFFLIGTALFVYYQVQPERLPPDVAGDQVFPFFIVNELPVGFTGLLIAAIFSAAMSTVSTSINSGATIILTDFVERGKRRLSERKKMTVLYLTSLLFGVMGIAVGLAMMSVKSALDAWWSMASIFSGGMLGLFLLGYLSRKAGNGAAVTGVVLGILLIFWMSLYGQTMFHNYLTIVFGTILIFGTGFLLGLMGDRFRKSTLSDQH